MNMLRKLRQVRGRMLVSLTFGIMVSLIFHIGNPDPAFLGWGDVRYWLHPAEEGILTFGIAGSVFILLGAAIRYRNALSTIDRSST
jgi:hypothetical protein